MENNESYYDEESENNIETSENSNSFFKKSLKAIIIIGLLIILIILFLLFNGCNKNNNTNNDNASVVLTYEQIELEIGKTLKIEYEIINGDNTLKIDWLSENSDIATVSETGIVTGLKVGSALISASYENINGVNKEYCVINVVKSKNQSGSNNNNSNSNNNNNNSHNNNNNTNNSVTDKTKPTVKVNFITGTKDAWNNKEVELEVLATDDSNKVNVKYAINCDKNCQYNTLSGSKLKVSTEGDNILTVIATDASNNTTKVEIPVKIDKESPSITLSEKIDTVVYDNTGTKEICAVCKDKGSGCKEEKVCKKITKTENNVIINVYDKAGNKASTQSFNVVYDNVKPTCSLKVSSSGNLTATYSDTGGSELMYYGFSSNYTGNNTSSMKVGTGTHTYYVKDKAGNTNTCKLEVKKKSVNCVCPAGYSVISQYSTTLCLKLDGIADWGDWVKGQNEPVDTCNDTCSTSKINTCYECEQDTVSGQYYRTTYTRTRTVCPSGAKIYNGSYCYYEKYKICDTKYYS